jgi:hypothetical protein
MVLMASYYENTRNYKEEYYFLKKGHSLNPYNLSAISGLSSYYIFDRLDAEKCNQVCEKSSYNRFPIAFYKFN